MKKKLIRADSLLEQIESPYVEYPIMIGIRKAIKEMIDEAPTVEAIPIEWIKNWIADNPNCHQVIWMLDDYRHPEMDWRKKNEL